MRFADPKNDVAFRKIFGDEHKKEILISFLNAVLDFKDENLIVDIKILNPHQVPRIEALKETILDIRATNQKNETFIVEMQKKDLNDFAKRSLYYTSKAYVEQLGKAKNYSVLQKIYFIGILNFNIFENDNYISRHLILNQATLKQELKDFEFSFIELSKFKKSLKDLNSTLDKWLFFIKNAKDLEFIPVELENIQELKEAFEVATQYGWNEEEMKIYDDIALKEFDDMNAIRTAESKGEKKGIEKGIKKGIKKGEKQAKMEIAKKSLLKGLDIETIVDLTGLTIEEIKNITKF
jgi:predicted transposase/invertase (TIGR01784 family)